MVTTTLIPQDTPQLPEILALHARWRADDEAVICESERLTWAQLMAKSHQLAHGLLANNIKPRSRVGVVMSNGIPMLQTLLGTMAGNIVSVPINLSVNDDALVNMMIDADVAAVVATADQMQRIDDLRSRLPESTQLFICAQDGNDHWLGLNALCEKQSDHRPEIAISDNDLLNVIYSSGTTGTPKGIAHTFRGRRDWAYDLTIALRYHGRARTLLSIGLYSNISWVGMLCTLLAGGTIVLHKKFDAGAFLQCVEQERITHTAMVPVQFQRIADVFTENHYQVGSMQAMMCCGSPLHPELKQTIFQYFPCGLIELYGLTEGIITTLDPEAAAGRWASVGRPLIGTDILILDDKDQTQPANRAGEIVSRGRIMMHGYYQNAAATQASLYTDAHGAVWLRSGDIGYIDEAGFLYIVDRKKDMILSGGQNIYPQDIEAVLKSHSGVYDVAVIGVSSKRWGETPLALVVPASPREDPAALLLWANKTLGKQQRLADLVFVPTLPRNPNGKLLKRELRKDFVDVCYE